MASIFMSGETKNWENLTTEGPSREAIMQKLHAKKIIINEMNSNLNNHIVEQNGCNFANKSKLKTHHQDVIIG